MLQSTSTTLGQVHALLAAKRYGVTETGDGGLRIQELDSGIFVNAVLQGEIMFFSLVCATVPIFRMTTSVMHKMLSAENGISTSYFQLSETGDGNVTVTLNNFCKLQEMGPDDEDDILSCVTFLLADVVHAKELIGADIQ
jgi:hypothetical protein